MFLIFALKHRMWVLVRIDAVLTCINTPSHSFEKKKSSENYPFLQSGKKIRMHYEKVNVLPEDDAR